MSNIFDKLYNKIRDNEPVVLNQDIHSAYGVVREAYTGPEKTFTDNALIEKRVPWKPGLEQDFYDRSKEVKGNAGPGEVSIALVLFRNTRGNISDKDILSNSILQPGQSTKSKYLSIINKMLVHGKGESIDLYNEYTNTTYEVKSATDTKSVQIGAESRGPGLELFYRIKGDALTLYKHYSKLSTEHKQLFEKHKDVNGLAQYKAQYTTFAEIMETVNSYFSANAGELSRGCIFPLKEDKVTSSPRLFLIPYFFTKSFFKDPGLLKIIPKETIEYLSMLYNTSAHEARMIDKLARDFLDRQKIINTGQLPPTNSALALNDLVLLNQKTVFASVRRFEIEVQEVFRNSDGGAVNPRSQSILAKILPNTGLFVVDPSGWRYAGRNQLSRLVRLDCITRGKYKILPGTEPERAETEPTADVEPTIAA